MFQMLLRYLGLVPVLLLVCAVSHAAGESADSETAGMGAGQPAEMAMAVLDAFMEGFNERDLEVWEATFHFPHFRFADGELTILPEAGERSAVLFDMLAATGWHHSAWLSREVVQAGTHKVHIVVEFARFREDGSELARYESLYVVSLEHGRWGIRGRSSFAP